MKRRQLMQSGAGMLNMYGQGSDLDHCFKCGTFMGNCPCECTVFTAHTPPGMLAHGKTARNFTNVKAFDDYIAAVRRLGLVVSFDSPQVARISKPTGSK